MAKYYVNMNDYPTGALSSPDWPFRQNNGDTAPATIEEYNQWKKGQIDAANNALPSSTPIVGFSGGYGGLFAGYGSALGLAKKNTGLVIDSSLHGHTVTSPVLKQAHRVAIANATHEHAATSPAIKQLHNLLIANTVHSVSSTSPVIATNHSLSIDSAIHQIVSDNVIIVTGCAAVPQDAVHNLTSDNISLQQYQKLIVQSATHALTSTSVDIIKFTLLGKPDDTVHGLASDHIGLSQKQILAIDSTIHLLKSGEIAKIFDWTELGVDFGNYKPGWNNSGKLTVAELDGAGIYIPSRDQDGAFELTDITGGTLIPNNIQKGKF